jgi:Ni/Co efflux regulator RcnB
MLAIFFCGMIRGWGGFRNRDDNRRLESRLRADRGVFLFIFPAMFTQPIRLLDSRKFNRNPNNEACCRGILPRKEFSMKKLHTVLALAILSTSLMGGAAFAQDHHDNHAYVEHKEWRKGAPIKHEDWDRADKVDYRQYHLNAPPRGYEWRMVDGNYVLVNSSNFQIRTVVRVQ